MYVCMARFCLAMAVGKQKLPRVKNVDKNTLNKSGVKKPKRNEDPRVILIAQEIRFAKSLAGNEKKQRDRSLKNLKRWFSARSRSEYGFTENDFMKIWKGLFYSMWMSDKPLIQEELCENIASLFDCFKETPQLAVLFFKCCMKTLATEWFGLDSHRIDKFLMFVRRIVRGMFRLLRDNDWSLEVCEMLTDILSDDDGVFCPNIPIYARNSLGLLLHITDLWNEELAKISEGEIPSDSVVQLLRPFALYLARGPEKRLCSSISKNIFTYLLKQSDLGIEYEDKADAWRRLGCPRGGVDAMVPVESDDDEDENKWENGFDSDDVSKENERPTALDPRAGRVDVVLAQLKPEPGQVATLLRSLTTDKHSSLTNRIKLKRCAENFESLANGKYPFVVQEFDLPTDDKFKLPDYEQSARNLFEFEKKSELEADELRLKGLNRKRKRKILEDLRSKTLDTPLQNGDSNMTSDDEIVSHSPRKQKKSSVNSKTKPVTNGWVIEEAKPNKPGLDESEDSCDDWVVEDEKKLKNVKLHVSKEKRPKINKENKIKSNKVKEKKTKENKDKLDESNEKSLKLSLEKLDEKNQRPSLEKSDKKSLKKSLEKSEKKGIKPSLEKSDKTKTSKLNHLNLKRKPKVENDQTPKLNNINSKSRPKSDESKVKSDKSKAKSSELNLSKSKLKKLSKSDHSITDTPKFKQTTLSMLFLKKPKSDETKPDLKKLKKQKLNLLKLAEAVDRPKLKQQKLNLLKLNKADPDKSSVTKIISSKKVNFLLKNNSSHSTVDYYKSVRRSPSIPFDCAKKPSKPLLKPHCTPSPINPFIRKKLRLSF